MKISVVVSTKNRSNLLRELIKSIKKSTFKNYEIIIVDASSKKRDIKGVRYIHAPEVNLSKARNIGIRTAKGDIIAFTDDDCEVDKNWLTEIAKSINDQIVCCTGRTITHTKFINELFEKNFGFDKGKHTRIFNKNILFNPWSIGSGNNMAFRRDVFTKIGYFDENFGMGTEYPTEDIDMFYRILKKNYRIIYNPKAIIYHKDKIKDVNKTAYQYGLGSSALLKKHHDLTSYILRIVILFKILLESIFNPIKREFLKGFLGW